MICFAEKEIILLRNFFGFVLEKISSVWYNIKSMTVPDEEGETDYVW